MKWNHPNPRGYEQSEPSRKETRLREELRWISDKRRKSIIRPYSEYSDRELRAAIELSPSNPEILKEIKKRIIP